MPAIVRVADTDPTLIVTDSVEPAVTGTWADRSTALCLAAARLL